MDQNRERQARRTRNARRAVIGLGAGGALTVAGVVGVGIAQAQPDDQGSDDSSTSRTTSDDDGGFQQDQQQTRQQTRQQKTQQNGQPSLAAPGNDGPAQGSTSGS